MTLFSTRMSSMTSTMLPLLLLLLLTLTGGIAGGSETSEKKTSTAPRRLVTTWPPKPTAKSWPKRLQTTWPTVAGRTSYVTPGVPRSKHDRHSTRFHAPLETRRLPSLATTKRPSYRRLTSAPVVYAGGPLVHCQVQLANNYQKMLNISGSWKHVYGRDLGSDIAHLCDVDEARISDVHVAENPLTGLMVLRFNIDRPLMSCRRGCFRSTTEVAETVRILVNTMSFNLSDMNWQTLYVQQLPAFVSWTDDGPCPDTACATLGHVCNLRLTGDFYCQCVTDCVKRLETDKSNNDLFALLVIPVVIIISLLVLLVLLLHKRRHKAMKTFPTTKTVRDYKPPYDVETLKQQPMLATLDPGANQLSRHLECQLPYAFHGQSFDTASFSGADKLVSPISTIRANSVNSA